jgi:hypothetical protein
VDVSEPLSGLRFIFTTDEELDDEGTGTVRPQSGH